MARGNNDREQGNDKGKIRFIIAEVEGNNQTLQDLVRTMSPLLARPVQVHIPPKLVQNGAPGPVGPAAPADPTLFNEPLSVDEDTVSVPADQSGDASNGAPRRKRGEGEIRDRNAGLTIVKSLNVRPDGKDSLKDFVSRKKPETQMEQIAVYVYYLKNVLEEANVGFSHIYTCFDEMGERMPGDVPQSCRNAANPKKTGWIDVTNVDDITITTRGKNLVEKDLPKASGIGGNG